MRWLSDPLKDRYNETRVIRKFLFFPCTLENETRWLEFSYIFQIVNSPSATWHNHYWRDIRFVPSSKNPLDI